jgi:hypothetical protein
MDVEGATHQSCLEQKRLEERGRDRAPNLYAVRWSRCIGVVSDRAIWAKPSFG